LNWISFEAYAAIPQGGATMHDWLELDSLHVISDLHLGGRAGFQIFGSTAELAWLVDHVAALQPGHHGLLINGDFIDFLAEESSTPFDPDGAVAKLDDVWSRFQPVFEALQRLLKTPQRRLLLNVGNHDLELALPWVRAHLAKRLAGDDLAAQSRLTMVTDGTGVRCRIGSARVVCVHGNEVDSWNVADYEHLRRIGRDRQFGRAVDAWAPNAGSRMVVEVMNEIKRHFPFVDLLKPETEGVLPILAALDSGVHRKLLDLAGVAGRRAWDIARMRAGFLDADMPANSTVADGYRSPVIFPLPAVGGSSEDLLKDVESAWHRGVVPMSLVRGTQAQQLGFWGVTRDLFSRKPKHEVVREALEYLDRDRSFDPAAEDDTFRDLDAMVGADVDLVVAGHTHLERSLPRKRGRGHYFNSGTWARLIRVDPAVRQDPTEFERLFRLLDGGTIDTLDKAKVVVNGLENDVVIRRNSVVVIQRVMAGAGSVVKAALHHVLPPVGATPIRLDPAPTAWTGS
jgi:UDP-2,3-diacylglucosamine pyrophosphatase LpxH